MVGRALRLSEDKIDAVILDCSNVISNLGLPTEDIKRRDNGIVKAIRVCSECKSEKLYKRVKKNRAYLYCADCGHHEDAMEEGYTCDKCGLVHSGIATFKTIDSHLYLVCDDCRHETLISESSSKEEMSLIFDPTYMNTLQANTTLVFYKYLMNKKGPAFILSPEVVKHTKALHNLILKEPSIFVDIDSYHCGSHTIVESEDGYSWKINYDEEWRLFDENWEDELLNEGLRDLNQKLKESTIFKNSIALIQNILKVTREDPLEQSFIEQVLEDAKKSKLENIDSICNKRVKDLHFGNEEIYSMSGFVQMMESVLTQK